MSSFVFFMSYARSDGNSYLDQFLQDLRGLVRGRMGMLESDPIFYRDTNEIQLGDAWPASLVDGLQNSSVIVALYTPLYFKRPICGQELGFFRHRMQQLANATGAFILPLLWIPCAADVPKTLSDLNYSHSDLPKSYLDKGLETLTRQSNGRFRDDYNQALDAIAERICAAAKAQPLLPPLANVPAFEKIRNVFKSEAEAAAVAEPVTEMQSKGPNSVGFVYVAGTKKQLLAKKNNVFYGDSRPAEWSPFVSRKRMIGALAPEVAGSRNFLISSLALNDNIADYVKAAENDNSILVLVVDTWSLHLLPEYSEWMERFDRVSSLHTSVIVVWNEDDLDSQEYEQLLKAQINHTFETQSTRDEVFFRPTVKNAAEFESALLDSLIRIQDKIIQNKETLQAIANSPFRKRPEIANAGQ